MIRYQTKGGQNQMQIEKVRLSTLTHSERERIRRRQMKGTMSDLVDSEGYICYDPKELEQWKPKKHGRPISKRS